MNIDGNNIQRTSIDGVTEIEITVGSAGEQGTDKMARGHFFVLVRGQKIGIYRNKRIRYEPTGNNDELKAAAVKGVFDSLTEIRAPVNEIIA